MAYNLIDGVFDPMDDFFGDFGKSLINSVSANQMKTDVEDNKDNYTVTSELPGINKDDIHLSYHDNQLNVKVDHDINKEHKDEKGNVLRQERSSSKINRSFYLPDVDFSKIDADFNDGILKITLPKAAVKKNDEHQIDIK